jgi:hypothetical protein
VKALMRADRALPHLAPTEIPATGWFVVNRIAAIFHFVAETVDCRMGGRLVVFGLR